tara:strand:- start:66 stop:410 length:345 start_codon:yes stop_codon:yes gene_type:complete
MKKLTKDEDAPSSRHRVGTLNGYFYNDLIQAFGDPTYLPKHSGDGKVQYEWVFEYDEQVFSIYDYKTYDKEYTETMLETWSVGGTTSPLFFIHKIVSHIKHSNKKRDGIINTKW